VHRYLLHNGEIRDTTEKLIAPGQVGFLNGWGIFSTLRVSQGILFAFERHWDRMRRDAERFRIPLEMSASELKTALLKLVAANEAFEATLRVAVVRNRGGLFEAPGLTRDSDLVAFTAPLANWGSGVKLSYVPHARHGASPFAGAKVTSWAQNLTWYEDAHARGFDEVVLLNEHGHISECTSANLFAIFGNDVITPPLGTSGCLPGVTRAILLEEIRIHGVSIWERELLPSDLENADQVFITSTTRDLLPVLEIDHEPLSQNAESLERLTEAFRGYRGDYVARQSRRETFAA
jgi:branched-chain amino acid aminotransferase